MAVILIPKHMMRKRLQYAHILSMIMHFHTVNVFCGVAMNVHISVLLNNKKFKNMKKQHPQLGFTLITFLDVVLLMVEFH